MDISPSGGNKSVPVRLAAVVKEDSRCVVVAPMSFWRLDGGLAGGAQRHWRPCPLCAVAVVIDPIHRSPFSHFPVCFIVLVLA